jgi:2-hydroxychromene-2-carboxylate isomerase
MGVRDAAPGAAMSANNTIDFWFTVGSTYTYLTVSRLHGVEAASGIRFRWRPFKARAIMQEMDNVPFATKPVKLAYMWRDVERRASRYELPLNVPARYPLKNFDLASRVAVERWKDGARTMCELVIGVGL